MSIQRTLRVILTTLLLVAVQAPESRSDEEAVREQLARSRENYTSAESWAERRGVLRREFLKGAGLWPLPERPPVKAILHSRREYAGYSVENVALETLPGFYCTGNLYRPLGRHDLGPAILCPHGHFRPLGRFRESQQIRCAHFARMGATVFSYSMVGWQDSQQTTHNDPLVLALQTWNSIRVVDYLCGLERVDPNRVGVAGASGGGTQAFFLALADERVKVSAPLVIVYPWSAPQGCLCEGGMPVMKATGTNAIELAAATAPRPQLLISVGSDSTRDFPTAGFPFIKQMYEVAGAGDLVKNVHFADEPHDFGPSKRKAVYEFFAKHLLMTADPFLAPKADQTGGRDVPAEDLAKITVEQPEQMAVFNNEHPLPDHALSGSDAIAHVFDEHLDMLRSRQRFTPEDASESGGTISPQAAPQAEYSFQAAGPDDEALLFTPAGFTKVGQAKVAAGADVGRLKVIVRDSQTGQPTFCRINIVGPDGNYYQPESNDLKEHSLTGVWPKSGWGNRPGKAPIRYFGRFFYCDGTASVDVPAGTVRVEVWKGFEYRPTTVTTHVQAGQTQQAELVIGKTVPMSQHGYWSGDPHLHIPRRDETDEKRIFDLMAAEDIHFATVLAYNQPAGPYAGFMREMESPQFRRLGRRSILSRGDYTMISGQEYRGSAYGHLNLFLLDELVLKGQSLNANHWPPYGHIVRETRELGGVAFYAHGGYAQEIYADVVQGNIDGVELLQFGVYRGIGLIDWYHMLNTGFRLPASGACDYPACRKLGDCQTYVNTSQAATDAEDESAILPSMEDWLLGMKAGRSFFTTGPLLLLDVDGLRPGDQIQKQGSGSHIVTARIRVRSEVAPVTNIQLIANGRVLHEMRVPARAGQGNWLQFEQQVELNESAWIAARAYSLSPLGTPDAESHTNPVYVDINGRAPYDQESLDVLVAAIDKQIAAHKKREFPEQAKVVAYFERSRDILMAIREAGGAPATGHPSDVATADQSPLDTSRRTHTDAELKAFLKPLPPKPIDEALRSFEAVDGFEMQLVAREPLVYDPIAAAFDESGNLYVCEMRDYPYLPTEGNKPIGTLRLLKDTDGDGVFDESHVFAEHLLWAGGVAAWKGGVFVAAPPDIWYMKDTDGDNRADVRRKVYTGFGTQNQQGMLNNLTWGLDHKIYGSTAGNGGTIRSVGENSEPETVVSRLLRPGRREFLRLGRRDFRFDPVTGQFEAITGTVQFGTTFDDWGNRFLCSESAPLYHAVLPEHYLARNPYLPVPYAIKNIAPRPLPIFRISPIERWRQIRSSRRIEHGERDAASAGASHHVIDAAAGVTVYRGGAYPPDYYGTVFIGDGQNNLIHHRRLTANGVTFESQRIEEQTEFVRSSDIWFRPVNFINAPDGTLYCLDMSREVLEAIHIPLDVVKHLDLTSGRKQGRIYRIAPPNFKSPEPPRLGKATTAELVAMLASPHGWRRDTAHRLINERQDKSAVEPLRRLLTDSPSPQARLHALWSLKGLATLTIDDLAAALGDSHAGVREQAMRLAEPRLTDVPHLLDKVILQIKDANARIQMQAAFTLGESRDPRAAVALADLARASSDRWIRTAVLSSASGYADRMLIELLEDAGFAKSPDGSNLLDQLASVVGSRNEAEDISRVLQALANHSAAEKQTGLSRRLLLAIGSGLKRSGDRFSQTGNMPPEAATFLQRQFADANNTATSQTASAALRVQAIKLLGCSRFDDSRATFERLLDSRQPEPVQIETVRCLAEYADLSVGEMLLKGWREQSPAVRQEVVEAMLARPDRTRLLLEAALNGDASVAQIDETRRSLLLKHSDAEIRLLAQQLFSDDGLHARGDVLADYRSALELTGDRARGETVFRRDCMACHKIKDAGHAIGPDLTSSASRDEAALLTHVLDPNRYVLPKYETYVVINSSGRVFTGMIAAQTATSLTLKRAENKTDTILRANIDELAGTGKSLMPEGFEKTISKQAMADLIAFLQASRPSSGKPSLDVGTLPGLVEPEPDRKQSTP